MTSPFRPHGTTDAYQNGGREDAGSGHEASPWAPGGSGDDASRASGGGTGGGGPGNGGEAPAPSERQPRQAPGAAVPSGWTSAPPLPSAAWPPPQAPVRANQSSSAGQHGSSSQHSGTNQHGGASQHGGSPASSWGPPAPANPWGPTPQPPPTPGNNPLGPPAPPSGYANLYRGGPQSAGRRRRRTVAAVVAVALVSAGIGGAVGAVVADDDPPRVVTTTQQRNGSGAPGTSPAAEDTVSAAAQVILPSTVTIAQEAGVESGTGSGVIIRPDGHILTNNHVVAGPSGGTLTVVLADGRTLGATVVGTDPSSDLAVIKVDATGLPAATIGDSEALSVGELVVAVGSPLGLTGTVTSGIVSSVHRPVRTGDTGDQNTVLDAIQTDAPINPGNSGGPLVNSHGEVVGINSAIATVGGGLLGQQQAGNIGVGFAIPSNFADEVATELIDDGVARHPYLGVTALTAGASGGAALVGSGAQIRDLVRNGPADQAGLRASDVVTKVGDRQVTDVDALIAAVRSHQIGETVTVTYLRDGQTGTVEVTLSEQPPN